MFNLLFARPIATLLAIAGAAVLAPVICPIVAIILKPLVKPVTNLYLDLADEMPMLLRNVKNAKALSSPKLTARSSKG